MALASTFQLWFYFTALLLPDVNTVVPGLEDDDELAALPTRLYTSPPCSSLTSGFHGVPPELMWTHICLQHPEVHAYGFPPMVLVPRPAVLRSWVWIQEPAVLTDDSLCC